MGVDYYFECKHCAEAAEALRHIDLDDVAETLSKESGYPYAIYDQDGDPIFFHDGEDIRANALIAWLQKHRGHGRIIFAVSI